MDRLFQNGCRHYISAIALELAPEGVSTNGCAGDDPTPKKPSARAEQAAQARAVKPAKPKGQAADAARKAKGKAKTSDRVAAAGGKGNPADELPPCRCPNTCDIFEGISA